MTKGLRLLGLLAVLASLFSFTGLAGIVRADHYSPATIEPSTIPLWGPSWAKDTVLVEVDAGKGVSDAAVQQVKQAIADWQHAIDVKTGTHKFTFREVTSGETPDVVVKVKRGGGQVQGQAGCKSSGGFFTSCNVNVSGMAFGSTNPPDTVRSIAIQELGHALGLLHSNNSADVMFGTLQDPANTVISWCDLDAWAAVMAWLLVGTTPAAPSVSSVSCGSGGGGGGGGGGTLNVTVTTDKASYSNRESAIITAHVTDGTTAVAGTTVSIVLTTANGNQLSCSPTTNSSGDASCRYRVNANRDGVGTYTVEATASKDGYTSDSDSTTFQVTG